MPLVAKIPNNHRSWPCSAIWLVLLGCLLAISPLSSLAAEVKALSFIQFSIQDESGNFFPQGEVEFCTPSGRCIDAAIQPGFPGNFYVPSEELHADTLYTVMIYDQQVKVLWELRDWVFEPEKYDVRWNRYLNLDKFLIFPRFVVYPGRRMTFDIDTTLNPEWERMMNRVDGYAGPDSLPDYPSFLAAAQVPVSLGLKFGSDLSAAGGVSAAKPGWGLVGVKRFGYPRWVLKRDHWAFFREVSLGYSQNRYETLEVTTPGRRSDVLFHQAWLAAGFGMINQEMTAQWSVAGAVSWGGLYDGTEVLKYLDRTYRMYGAGFQLRAVQSLWETERADFGLTGQAHLIYYFADTDESDFWLEWAPSISVGLVVY
ncbi:MAG: hypothetical protein KOO60_01915 [Gemmatimonadales bacterium]|nr:hypothetical protein [Gemmatimonadales bacterium]